MAPMMVKSSKSPMTVALLGQIAAQDPQDAAQDVALIRAAMAGAPLAGDLRAQAARGAAAVFPLAARDLMPALQGEALGRALDDLREAWIAADFTLTRDELLALHSERR
ncbi:MAG: hypothetical protein R6W95_15490 [Desulfosarcina sp.]